MLMESHTLGKGCKIHGVESLIPRPLLNKASMTGYHVCVASKRGWCLGQLQEGSPRLLKMEAHCSLGFCQDASEGHQNLQRLPLCVFPWPFLPENTWSKACDLREEAAWDCSVLT